MTTDTYRPVSVGNWMLTMLLMSIPLINIILLFVWAFGSDTEVSKANWAKAALIWLLIGIIPMALLLFLGIGTAVFSSFAG